jgi:Transposase zinc-binding domain
MPRLSSPTAAAGTSPDPQRPPFEVAEVVREYGAAFRATHHVSHEQERVLQAIAHCRTAALGGQVEVCESCETEQLSYNSCLMGSIFLWGVLTTKDHF